MSLFRQPPRRPPPPQPWIGTLASADRTVNANAEGWQWNAQGATVDRGRDVTATAESWQWNAQASTVDRGRDFTANAEGWQWNGQTATVDRPGNREVSANVEAWQWASPAATVDRGRDVTATAESWQWAAQSATVTRSREVTANAESWQWAAQGAAVARGDSGRAVLANVEAWRWTAHNAVIRYVSGLLECLDQDLDDGAFFGDPDDDVDCFFVDDEMGFSQDFTHSGNTYQGIFDSPSTGGGDEKIGPRLWVTDVTAAAMATADTVTIEGATYVIAGIQPDGTGVSLVVLYEDLS